MDNENMNSEEEIHSAWFVQCTYEKYQEMMEIALLQKEIEQQANALYAAELSVLTLGAEKSDLNQFATIEETA